MRVNLAVQVLSNVMATALNHFDGNECTGTANFCSMLDQFFNYMNVRNTGHVRKLKPNLAPYRSLNDTRFSWLKENLLGYFLNGKKYL